MMCFAMERKIKLYKTVVGIAKLNKYMHIFGKKISFDPFFPNQTKYAIN